MSAQPQSVEGPTTVEEFEALFEGLKDQVGDELGVTDWFTVEQRDLDLYSALIDDWDYMHNDPEWAEPRFGGTIAHGLYSLSLVPKYLKEVSPALPIVSVAGVYALNYGFGKVRYPAPWRVGQRARDHVVLSSVTDRPPQGFMVTMTHTFELEDESKPCMVAEHMILFTFGEEDQ